MRLRVEVRSLVGVGDEELAAIHWWGALIELPGIGMWCGQRALQAVDGRRSHDGSDGQGGASPHVDILGHCTVFGCDEAARHGIKAERVVNTWDAGTLIAWAASHA